MSFWEDYLKGGLLVVIGFVIALTFYGMNLLYVSKKNERFNKLECIRATGQFNQCEKVFEND